MIQLYAHQQKIIDEDPKKAGLFLGTGSGKSRTALYLARGRTLVVCPKTIRDARTWETEQKKLGLDLDLTVISKEDFKKFEDKNFQTLIFDEAHTVAGVTPSVRYRNRQAVPKTSKLFEKVIEFVAICKPERLYLLTATPVRSPMVVWGLAQILGRKWDFYKFRDIFYFKIPVGREVYMARKDEKTKERLGKIVRSLGYTGQLSDYFDVPEQTWRTVYLELTKEQERRIASLEFEFPDPLVLCGKRHQVENGTLAGNEFQASERINDEKIDQILEFALEFPKMAIFAKYLEQIYKIETALRKEGYDVRTMTGQTKDREAVIRWANEIPKGILIVQSSISSGWEIPEIPVVIYASQSYSIVDHVQSIGRVLRANKLKKNLYIHLVVRGGVDEAVYEAIINKQDFSERIYAEQNTNKVK